MSHKAWRRVARVASVVVALALGSTASSAQYLGFNLRGDVGLKAGSPPLPGVYLTLPLYYGNDIDGIRDADGNELAQGLDLDLHVLVAPGVTYSSKWKILGGTYGFSAVLPFMSDRLSVARPDVTVSASYGLGDLYVQPLVLGWRSGRIESRVGYAFFAPTGKGTRSLDMWGHELSAGGTVYFDDRNSWNVSGLASYEIHGKKSGQDLRVGDILTIEGGAAKSFMKGMASAGVAYVAQWKITNDSGDDFPDLLTKSKSRVFGLGPEVDVPVYTHGTFAALLSARYVFEFGARASFESKTLVAGLTLAKLNLP